MKSESERLERIHTALEIGRNVILVTMLILLVVVIASPLNIKWIIYVTGTIWGAGGTLFIIKVVLGWDYNPKD